MPEKKKVLDIWYSLFLYVGGFLMICAVGLGFDARAVDHSPWKYWIPAPFFMVPFAVFVWLADTGRIETVDTRKVELEIFKAKLPPLPRWARVLISIWGLLTAILQATDRWWPPIVVDWIDEHGPTLPHLHLFMWGVFFAGAAGTIWAYRRVSRAVNTPTTPTPPGTEDRPGA